MEFIKNLKVRNKLIFLITIFATGFLLFGTISVLTLNKTRVNGTMYKAIIQGKDLVADILPPPEYIIESYLTSLQILEESQLGKSRDAEQINKLIRYIDSLKENYELRHNYWLNTLNEGEIKKLLVEDSYAYAIEFYNVLETGFIPAIKANNSAEIESYRQQLKAAYENHRQVIDKLVILTNEANEVIEKKANLTILLSVIGLITVIIILILTITLIFYKISIAITRPLLYISETMQEIAAGDLSLEIDENFITKDEIGGLCQSVQATTKQLNTYLNYITEITQILDTLSEGNLNFTLTYNYSGGFASIKNALNNISLSLNTMLSNINESAHLVAANSKSISEGSDAIAKGASEQAAVIEEILSSVTDIADLVQSNSKDAENVAALAHVCKAEVKQVDTQMTDLLTATYEINRTSQEVNRIMDTINGITHKTNLLAFNASIEAARQGAESSAAFGVIANEIRHLASQTADATKLIETLITNSSAAANKGSSLAADTAKSLKNIVEEFSRAADLVSKIAAAGTAQTAAIQEVSLAIEQISKVVQENAAVSEESASTSDALYDNALNLRQLISKFHLKQGEK